MEAMEAGMTAKEEAAIKFHDSLVDNGEAERGLAMLEACAVDGHLSLPIHLRIAAAMESLGRHRDAIDAYDEVGKKFGQSSNTAMEAFCWIRQGLLLVQTEEETARVLLQRGLAVARQTRPDLSDYGPWSQTLRRGLYELGRLLYLAGDFVNALALLQDLDHPPEAHYYSALAQAKASRQLTGVAREEGFRKSLKHCQSFLELRDEPQGYHVMGDIYQSLHDYEHAAESYANAAKLAQQKERFSFESYMWWASGCVKTEILHKYEAAILDFTFSLEAALNIIDTREQAGRMLNASTWLEKARSMVHGDDTDGWEPISLDHPSLSQITSFNCIRGEALYVLGNTRVLQGNFRGAHQCFKDAMCLMDGAQSHEGYQVDNLVWRLYFGLAQIASHFGQCDEALQLYEKCKVTAPSQTIKLKCHLGAAFTLKLKARFYDAFEAFTQILEDYCMLLDTEWGSMAHLLLGLGQTLLAMGNWSEAALKLKAARSILEEKKAFDSETLGMVYLAQFYLHLENQQFWDAFQLAKSFQDILNVGSSHEQALLVQYMFAVASVVVANYEQTSETLTDLESQWSYALDWDWLLKCGILLNLANAYKNLGDYDSALCKLEEARDLVPDSHKSSYCHIFLFRADIHMKKFEEAQCFSQAAQTDDTDVRKAWDEYERAITIQESILSQGTDTNLLAMAYAGQALALYYMENLEEASRKLEKAHEYVGSNKILIAKLKRIQAHIYAGYNEYTKALNENQEAAILYATLQLELQDLEWAWVSLLGGEMRHAFFFMEWLLIQTLDYLKGLLWAERGRMRLYFHLVDQDQKADLDSLWFDKDDELAKECIHQALINCSSGTAIIEYTYTNFQGPVLCIYVLLAEQASDQPLVNFKQVDLRDFFFKVDRKSSMGCKTLEFLVKRTRSEILKCADDKAKQGLSTLYRLLIDPIWNSIASCKSLIFAPHDSLSLVPFSALYDSAHQKFLIETKAVSIVPSIRTLHQCFIRQAAFEARMQAGTTASAFVAGDPEPMGLRLPQLNGARSEANAIARKLGVEPLIGSLVTKHAVINGLQNASVILLVTHGIVNPSFPHGALVMQGQVLASHPERGGSECPLSLDTSLRSFALRGMPNLSISQSRPAGIASDQVLTADEIGKLKGVNAGLVVLSACQTGEGEVSNEGLLGLGRATLQAGVPSVALMLWKVDDKSTKKLVTGLFEHLVDSRETIITSVQLAMLQMINAGFSIYEWAPLITYGSPTLRLVIK